MKNYTVYHLHDETSLLDSCTNFKLYVDKAVELGQSAIAFTNHATLYNWVERKMYCDKKGIKYMHGVEMYLTETHKEKVRDNYHTVLIAKNWDGVLELNELLSIASTEDDHFYYKPRISFDEFLAISDNVIKISACLASPLNQLKMSHPYYERLVKHYDYLEIQPHDVLEQIKYNQHLYMLSEQYKIPLVAGTDTHSLDQYKAECRTILQLAKRIEFTGEDEFDLTYKSYDELVEMFRKQDALPESVFLQAIENTNVMADSVEPFELDLSFKYPKLYADDEAVFKEVVGKKFREKVSKGIIPQHQLDNFKKAIEEEDRVFGKIDMRGFMLSMSEFVSWCRENDIPVGFNRGSVGGSRIAYITDIIDLNPETWKTVFSRFANESRKEIGDIDVDLAPDDRDKVYDYIIKRFGQRNTAFILALGTISDKGTIDEIGRALASKWEKENIDLEAEYALNREEEAIRSQIKNEKDKSKISNLNVKLAEIHEMQIALRCKNEEISKNKNPYSLKNIARIKKEFEVDPERTKEKYPELFYYFDGLVNTVISQSMHPAGIVVSPVSLPDNYGVFKRDGKIILQIDMDSIHEVSLVKYDILGLKNIAIIRDTYRLIGKPYPRSHEIDWNDQAVWKDMLRSPVGIFQFEGEYAFSLLKKFEPKNIFDMSLVTAALRPSGASYRDALMERKVNKNPSEIIDKLLEDNLGYLIYQEDTIKFLQDICGMSGSEADNIRRAIGRKDRDRLEAALPDILEGYCANSPKPREIAEEEAKAFLKIIEDSAEYQFGYNHSIGYCLIGYLCAYLRYYYPYEFITAYLNNASNQDDITAGSALAHEYGINISPARFRYSRSDYAYNKETKTIYKGMSSIKYLNQKVSEELYALKDNTYGCFSELLVDIAEITSLDSRQLEVLIKIDFFEEFGNSKELMLITKMFDLFKQGTAKTISKDKVDDKLAKLIEPFVDGNKKDGSPAKAYTIKDMAGVLRAAENYIRIQVVSDYSYKEKMEFQKEYLGYIDLTTHKPEDRRKLFVTDLIPLRNKTTQEVWGYAVFFKSIGSGKTGRMTIRSKLFDQKPFKQGTIIYAKNEEKNNAGYWYLLDYSIIA